MENKGEKRKDIVEKGGDAAKKVGEGAEKVLYEGTDAVTGVVGKGISAGRDLGEKISEKTKIDEGIGKAVDAVGKGADAVSDVIGKGFDVGRKIMGKGSEKVKNLKKNKS